MPHPPSHSSGGFGHTMVMIVLCLLPLLLLMLVLTSGDRIFELAPWPSKSMLRAPAGTVTRAETSPLSGVAINLISLISDVNFLIWHQG